MTRFPWVAGLLLTLSSCGGAPLTGPSAQTTTATAPAAPPAQLTLRPIEPGKTVVETSVQQLRMRMIDPRNPFAVKLAQINGEKAEIKSGEQAQQIRAELEASALHVARIIEKEIHRKARAPFITSSLQQAASSVCGFAPAS